MANTSYLTGPVEDYVRGQLAQIHGVPFLKRFLPLVTGGRHEFDAVSGDGSIVASIKATSGLTSSGKLPIGKFNSAMAEIYYLSLVRAPSKMLVLTFPPFYKLLEKKTKGALLPDIRIECVPLPAEMQANVDRVLAVASKEVQPQMVAAAVEGEVEAAAQAAASLSTTEVKRNAAPEGDGCREEVVRAARHLHDLGHADFSPAEIVQYMQANGTRYEESTIRTHVVSRMCGGAPDNHQTTYDDLERVAHARYRLRNRG